MSDTQKKRINVYMPHELYEELKRIADEQDRSLNWLCVSLLVKALEHEKVDSEK